MVSFRYDHPTYMLRHPGSMLTLAGNAAVTAKMFMKKIRLRQVIVGNLVAGTSAGHTVAVLAIDGTTTTTIGTATPGTAAAGGTTTFADQNLTLNAGARLQATNGTDATGRVDVMHEYHVLPDATFS